MVRSRSAKPYGRQRDRGDETFVVEQTLGKANPYAEYDVADNTGWVSVGADHDTAASAVNNIATRWQPVRQTRHPERLGTRTRPGY